MLALLRVEDFAMKRRITISVLIAAAAVIPMTGCPPDDGYGFQPGLWHIAFSGSPMVYGIDFTSGGGGNLGFPVDVGFGKLPGVFFWNVKNNVVTMEQVVNGETAYTYSGTMSSHFQMSGEWEEVGEPFLGQWDAIHSDPLPLEE